MFKSKIEHLVKHLKAGKKEYFDAFYELTKRGVYYSAWQILKNQHTAEDVMQETYLAFINNINTLDEEKNYYYYLLTIAKNKALNLVKYNARQVYVEDWETVSGKSTDRFSPLIDICKQKLSEDEWYLIEQCVILGYKRVEVAKILNKPIATVNWQYNKALEKAKLLYKEVYNEN